MPTPRADETRDEYMGRCMGDDKMLSEYPENDQRAAVCNAYWDRRGEMQQFAEYRGQEIDLKPTDEMKTEAERFLAWRAEGRRGGTEIAVARATQLKNREQLSADTVRRMFSFFSRHEIDKRAEGFSPGESGYPSPGRVAWAAWGGDAGFSWSRSKTEQLDRIDKRMSARFADLRGAEIFSVGKWNGLEFSDADIDAIVESFNTLALNGRVPLKLGHNDEQSMTDGQPALGWVSKVWREGEKIMADFTSVPSVIYDAIKNKLYNFVSVELLQDAEQDGSRYPWVLSAVALLGADRPAVSNLQELSRLTMSCRKAYSFARAGTINFTGAKSKMAEVNIDATLAELAELKAKLATFSAENEAIKAERDKVIEDGKKEKAAAIKAAVEQKFESAIAAKRLLPAARERFFKWTFPKDIDAIVAFESSEVDSYIKENETVSMSDSRAATAVDKSEEGKSADAIVAGRVKKFMADNKGVSYKDAMVSVLRDDPALANDYRFLPDGK